MSDRVKLLPRVVKVIESHTTRGCGVTRCAQTHEHEPTRLVVQYHTLKGELLAENDHWRKEKERWQSGGTS